MRVTEILAICVLSAASLGAADADFQRYTVNWRDNGAALVNGAALLDAPAGKHGFVVVRDGHLATRAGRLRLWGMNVTSFINRPQGDLPISKADAPMVAAFLARHGINCVRLHSLERTVPPFLRSYLEPMMPAGIIDLARNDTSVFDAERLDRVDFFVAELKKRGIYVDLNLNVGRTYKAGDGVEDSALLGYAKGLTYFDPRIIELQREYARQLLTHRNPYTGNEYRHEPAVALIEMLNENSLVGHWVGDRLAGKSANTHNVAWGDIPPSYEKKLTALYQEWRKQRGEPPVPRLRKAEFAAADAARFRSEAAFYMDVERRFFQSMAACLKNEIGVKQVLVGTSDHGQGSSGYPLLSSTSQLDVVDGHAYWQHPSYKLDPDTGIQTGFSIGNTPMVDVPLSSIVVRLSRSAVAGKPFIVSEANHPFPSEYSAEGIPVLVAYAALQDWDGVFWYSMQLPVAQWRQYTASHFEFRSDPVKMSQIAAGAYMFLRGDVHTAARTVGRGYSREQVEESLRMPAKEAPFFTPGFAPRTALEHGVRIVSFDRAVAAESSTGTADPIVSDTKELTWHSKPGLVVVDTERTQAIIGFTRERPAATRHLKLHLDNRFVSVELVSLDGAPVARSRSLALLTGAQVRNSGMQWSADRKTVVNWGKDPTEIEPVRGSITLLGLKKAKSVRATPLDGAGRPAGAAISAQRTTEGWGLRLSGSATPWYQVVVK